MKKFISEKHKKAQMLKSGYTPAKRTMEIVSISLFAALLLATLWAITHQYTLLFDLLQLDGDNNSTMRWVTVLGVMPLVASLLGIIAADFVAGVVHWGADTWGTIDWPIVGQTFIRSFREHHIDPQAMCRHDWIETNGDNCLISALFMLIPYGLIYVYTGGKRFLPPLFSTAQELVLGANGNGNGNSAELIDSFSVELFLMLTGTLYAIFIALTNQFHKWSHTYNPPAYVKVLQNCNLILGRGNHNRHHKTPFDRNYCITTGWLNGPLQWIRFWRFAEFVIHHTTGLEPRSDDLKWNDHLDLLNSEEVASSDKKDQ